MRKELRSVNPSKSLRKYHDVVIIDIASGDVLLDYWHWEQEGNFTQAKKGRGEQQQVTNQELGISKAETPTYLAGEQPLLDAYSSFTPSSPNSFSPAVQSEYDADVSNLRNTYGNIAQSGFRTLAARGFGSAPTGAASSLLNQNAQNEGNGEQTAYQNAQRNNVEQGFRALQGKQGVLGMYNPQEALSGASTSAYRQSQMGSTLGDIGNAITAGAGSAAKMLTAVNS